MGDVDRAVELDRDASADVVARTISVVQQSLDVDDRSAVRGRLDPDVPLANARHAGSPSEGHLAGRCAARDLQPGLLRFDPLPGEAEARGRADARDVIG